MVILTLMAASAWAAWEWQTNAYGQRLAQQETEHQTVLSDLANANSALIIEEQGKRHARCRQGGQPAHLPVHQRLDCPGE